ncbi:29084_t:CDS:1, partial [Racocetra persica]
TIDYSCGSSFSKADNLFGVQNQQSISKPEDNLEIKSNSELVVARLGSKNKRRVSNEIESSSKDNSTNETLLLSQNKMDDLQYSDSEIWKNLFYKSTDINSELIDSNESDNYDNNELVNSNESDDNDNDELVNSNESDNDNDELVNSNESDDDFNIFVNSNESDDDFNESVNNNESDKLVDSEKSDYDSETKSLSNFGLLDADKPTIKQLFEKVFVNDRLTCNSPMEKAYYSAQIFLLLCYKCGDTDIVIPIPATQYPLCTECIQK